MNPEPPSAAPAVEAAPPALPPAPPPAIPAQGAAAAPSTRPAMPGPGLIVAWVVAVLALAAVVLLATTGTAFGSLTRSRLSSRKTDLAEVQN